MSALHGLDLAAVKIEPRENPCDGIKAFAVNFESAFRRAVGRAVVITPSKVELRLYPFYELIHRSWRPGTRNFVREAEHINLGTSVRQFIREQGGPELKDLCGDRGARVQEELARCVFACNTLQTGFVRGNGFIIASPKPGLDASPELICKPPEAPGRYDAEFLPLGPAPRNYEDSDFEGRYDTMILAPTSNVDKVKVAENTWKYQTEISLAFSSPIILWEGEVREIPYHENPKNANDPTSGRGTIGSEVNWPTDTTATSFTAFGCRADGAIVVVSMFQSTPGRDFGIFAREMAELLKAHFNVTRAVIGGGSADTQQFLRGDTPADILEATARPKTDTENAAVEVSGVRGLGAIFAVLKKP